LDPAVNEKRYLGLARLQTAVRLGPGQPRSTRRVPRRGSAGPAGVAAVGVSGLALCGTGVSTKILSQLTRWQRVYTLLNASRQELPVRQHR
jgi:hypothetical protein